MPSKSLLIGRIYMEAEDEHGTFASSKLIWIWPHNFNKGKLLFLLVSGMSSLLPDEHQISLTIRIDIYQSLTDLSL